MASVNEPIAIDFGTTNTMAFGRQKDQIRVDVISAREYGTQDKDELPSYVAYRKITEPIVGVRARKYIPDDKYHVIAAVKRILGLTYEEYAKMEGNDVFGCEIQEINGYPYFVIGDNGETKSPIDIASEIFKAVKKSACEFLNRSVTDAYVTVPATYNDRQINAIREAAEKGGLNVVRMIKEPSAAAMAWFLDKESGIEIKGGEKIVVYDFGGGTFDVCLLHAISNSQFEILGKAGNCRLGGNDIDTSLQEKLLEKYKTIALPEDYNKVEKALKRKKKTQHKFRVDCEDVKIKFSSNCGECNTREELLANNKDMSQDVEIANNEEVLCTLKDLLEVSDPIVNETIRITKEMITTNSQYDCLLPGNISHVIIVEGSSLLPSVKLQLKELFPSAEFHCKNRMEREAVGRGAMNMILADLENGKDYLNEKIECSFGLETKDGIVPMLQKGSNITCTATRTYATIEKEQAMIYTTVYKWYGNTTPNKKDADCFVVKELAIRNRDYTGKEEGGQKFDFRFALHKGSLTVTCTLHHEVDKKIEKIQLSQDVISNAYSCYFVCCDNTLFQNHIFFPHELSFCNFIILL